MGQVEVKKSKETCGIFEMNKERLSVILFYTGYTVWLVWKLASISMFSFAEGSSVNSILHLLSLAILLSSSVVMRIFDNKTILAGLLCLFGLVVKVSSGNILFVDLALLFYASRCTSFRSIARFSLGLLGLGSMTIVSATIAGVIPDYLFSRGEAIRHGLGFLYSTNLSHLYLNIVLLYLFDKREGISCAECLLLLSVDILLFILTDSRNSCGLVAIALVFALAFKWGRASEFERVFAWFARCSFGVFTVVLIVAALMFDPADEGWKALNRFTSNRIAQDHASLIKYGVKPFGQEIEFSNRTIAMGETDKTEQQANPQGDPNIVESSFLNILITKGYVTLLLVLFAFWIAMRHESDRWMSLIMLMIAAHSAFDFQLTNLLYTTFLMWVWDRVATSFAVSKVGARIDRSIGLAKIGN